MLVDVDVMRKQFFWRYPVICHGEDGEIIGRGRHDELLETCPTYAEIVESQIGQGAVA